MKEGGSRCQLQQQKPLNVPSKGALDSSLMKWFFNPRTLTVGHDYLECLLQRDELAKRGLQIMLQGCVCSNVPIVFAGVKFIEHKQTSKYYRQLLGKSEGVVANVSAIQNDNAWSLTAEPIKKRPRAVRDSVPVKKAKSTTNPLLAIEDADESDHDGNADASDVSNSDDSYTKQHKPPADLAKGTRVDRALSRSWGPFKMNWVWRVRASGPRKGTFITQWECVCLFHKDDADDDAAEPKCRKTVQFIGKDDCEKQFVFLKRLSLLGRHCQSRAGDKSPHLKLNLKNYLVVAVDELDAQLSTALTQEWVLPPNDDDSSMSSISSSSSSSSS